MVVKPWVLLIVASLVVAAAGGGAYLAVRSSVPAAPVADGMMTGEARPDVDLAGSVAGSAMTGAAAVDATEEIVDLEDVDGVTETAPAPADTAPVVPRPADRRSAAATAPAPAAQPVANRTTEPATPPSATPRGATPPHSLPEVDGWTRTDRPETTTRPQVRSVSLGAAASSLGTPLPPEERPRIIEELIISADSVIGLQVDTPVSTEDAQVEDDVEARVTRDVLVGDEIAIPAGARVLGSVVLVEQAGQLKGSSRLGVRFHTVVFDDGAEVPLVTETVYREGKSEGADSAAKIGGAAVGGAILGAIFGGRQGAAIGGAAGAAGGTAVAMSGDAQPATLPAGAALTVRLSRPATVTVER